MATADLTPAEHPKGLLGSTRQGGVKFHWARGAQRDSLLVIRQLENGQNGFTLNSYLH